MKKRILSIFVTVLMAFAMMPMSVSADTTMSGDGSIENPYKISNYMQLKEFANIANGEQPSACAVLAEEIEYIGTDWVPIGTSSKPYTGTFNGDGYTINKLSNASNGVGADYQGLFGYIGSNGKVMNVGLKGGEIVGQNDVGGLAGYSEGGKISNCFNTGTVSGSGNNAGGIAGKIKGGEISNCFNTGTVSGSGSYSGGVTGNNDGGKIYSCYNTGAVSGSGSYSGGVVGYNNSGKISNCYNIATVIGLGTYAGGVTGLNNGEISNCYNSGKVSSSASSAGGLAGSNHDGTITYCYNTGAVKGEGSYAGGLAGSNFGEISNCYNSGKVSCSANYAGGLAGFSDGGTITYCYNTGKVSCSANYAGGLAGSNHDGTITYCYNTGAVGCENNAGGLVGANLSDTLGEISNCYNSGEVSCEGDNTGGLAGYNFGEISNCYYDTNFCTASKAVGYSEGTDNVKGLDTFKMTGERAKEDSNMKPLFDGESPWLTRSDGVYANTGAYYLYYPHLKGFNFDSDNQPMDPEEIALAGWPAKVTIDAEWNGSDSYIYNGDSQKPAVKVTISNDTDTVTAKDYTLNYYEQTGEDQGTGDPIWSPVTTAAPIDVGHYKAVVTLASDGNEGFEKVFEIKPAPLTITANDQTYEYNGEMQGPGDKAYADPAEIAEVVTVKGLQGNDKLTGIQVDGQGQKVDTYELMPSGALINDDADAKDNYDITYVSGKLTIKEQDPEPKPTPTPTPKPEPKPTPAKISGTLLTKMTSKGDSSLALSWSKVKGAQGYDIFFVRCGDNDSLKKVKTIKGNKTLKWTKKGLRKKTAYKAVVKAWIKKGGKKTYVKISPAVHAYTSGGKKYFTNPEKVTVKPKVSLKKGKTFKIEASVTGLQKGKALIADCHAPELRYVSSNKKIVTVSKAGKVSAKGKGKCKVYVLAINGVRKAVAVTVK